MPTNPPRHEPKPAPPSLKKAGKAFWTDVLSAFTLEPHHLFVLEAAGIQLDRAGEAAKRRETAATPTEADRAEAAERAAHSLFLKLRRELGLDIAMESPRGPGRTGRGY